jgi:hypothetical protein
MMSIDRPLVFSVRRTARGWRCTCAWCQQRRWNGSEPDRHPIICNEPEREPKPVAKIVRLPRRHEAESSNIKGVGGSKAWP